MTLRECQELIMSVAWWLGDFGDPRWAADFWVKPDSRLREDLHMNETEIKALFHTTDVRTVQDCLALPSPPRCDALPF